VQGGGTGKRASFRSCWFKDMRWVQSRRRLAWSSPSQQRLDTIGSIQACRKTRCKKCLSNAIGGNLLYNANNYAPRLIVRLSDYAPSTSLRMLRRIQNLVFNYHPIGSSHKLFHQMALPPISVRCFALTSGLRSCSVLGVQPGKKGPAVQQLQFMLKNSCGPVMDSCASPTSKGPPL